MNKSNYNDFSLDEIISSIQNEIAEEKSEKTPEAAATEETAIKQEKPVSDSPKAEPAETVQPDETEHKKPETADKQPAERSLFSYSAPHTAAAGVNDGAVKKKTSLSTVIMKVITAMLITCLLCLCGGLGVEYVIVKGPSPALRDTFVMTMLETRRFGFIPNLILSEEEVEEIKNKNTSFEYVSTDTTLINVGAAVEEHGDEEEAPVFVDEDGDGDGIVLETVKGRGFVGYMMIVLDPTRVIVGSPAAYGGVGLTIEQMCDRYDAVGGINGGGFLDLDGTGLGGYPMGLTVVDGVFYNEESESASFVGIDDDGILHVGYMTAQDVRNKNIRNGVNFGPILVSNGEAADASVLTSGINPRTAIGQRADGAILMLVVDGRQVFSVGATYADIAEVMLNYGAVNACNLDGGSSSSMYLHGEYVNSCSAAVGARPLPTAFLVKR